ncbi:MAG: hypothetical protein K6E22_11950 [Treponema sp.]|nr:hypothetical protein [Treponema sp.]
MKKTLALILAAIMPASLFAAEFGGTLCESVELYTNDFDPLAMEEKTKVTLFFRTPVGQSSYFVAEGKATPTYDVNDLSEFGDGEFKCPVDLTLFKYAYSMKTEGSSSVNVAAGRFGIVDTSGCILNQISDGLSASYSSQKVVAGAYAGYTGLLNGIDTVIVGGDLDDTDNDYYYCASPFLLGQASVYFPYLFLNQSVGLEGLCAIGMKGPNGDNADCKRFFGTLSLGGSLGARKFYSLSSTFGAEIIDGEFDKISNLSQLSFSYYIPEFYDSQVTLHGLYASGENGPFAAFKGITSIEATYSMYPSDYSGLLKTGLSGTFKPKTNMLASLGTDLVFSCPDDSFEYAGIQIYGEFLYQMYTDLQLGLVAHQYFGDDSDDNETALTLYATLAF